MFFLPLKMEGPILPSLNYSNEKKLSSDLTLTIRKLLPLEASVFPFAAAISSRSTPPRLSIGCWTDSGLGNGGNTESQPYENSAGWLVVWNMNGLWLLGISWSQLTLSHMIFQRGRSTSKQSVYYNHLIQPFSKANLGFSRPWAPDLDDLTKMGLRRIFVQNRGSSMVFIIFSYFPHDDLFFWRYIPLSSIFGIW